MVMCIYIKDEFEVTKVFVLHAEREETRGMFACRLTQA